MSLKIDRVQLDIIIGNDAARKEMSDLEGDIKRFTKELAKMKKEGKEDTEEWKAKKAELDKARQSYDAIIDKIGIAGLTTKELIKRQRELKAILDNVRPNTPEYAHYEAQLKSINTRLGELRAGHSNLGNSLQGLKGKFVGVMDMLNPFKGGLLGILAVITSVVAGIKEYIQYMAKMSDARADVMKTTGLTLNQVKELEGRFKELNTRTSTEDLLKLAEDAGRLGKEGVPAILEFVDAANQIKTALGDDLGQDAIKNTGKLAEAFNIAKVNNISYKDALLKTGSVMNTVAAKSSADADYLVDFSKRVAGAALQQGISLQNIMGIASALDQNLQTSEQSSTVVTTLLTKMFSNTSTYARLAGMDVQKFNKLLKTDANTAFISLLKNLKNNNSGFTELAQNFEQMGFDGTRAINVIGVLSGKVEMIEQQQKLANDAFRDGTSIIGEYNTKNETFGGNVDKIGKGIKNFVLDALSPLGDVAEKAASGLASIFEVKQSDVLIQQREEMDMMVTAITGVNVTIDERRKLIDELNSKYPNFLQNLDKEKVSNEELKTRMSDVNAQFEKKILMELSQEKIKETMKDILELEAEKRESIKKMTTAQMEFNKIEKSASDPNQQMYARSLILKYKLDLESARADIVKKQAEIEAAKKNFAETTKDLKLDFFNFDNTDEGKKKAQEDAAKAVTDLAKATKDKNAALTEEQMKSRQKMLEELRQITLKYQAQAVDDEVVKNERERLAAVSGLDEKLKDKDGKIQVDLKKTKEYQEALTALNEDYANKEQQIWLKNYEKRLKNNEEFIVREMSDNRLTYADKLSTLEQYYADELISREYYESEKLKLTNDMRQKLDQLEKEYNLVPEADKRALDLAMYQQFLDAKLISDEQYAKAKKAIENKLTDEEKRKLEEKKEMYKQVATSIGNAVYAFTSGQSKNFKQFGKDMILIALDLLKKEAEIAIAKITIGSLASAESIASWGVAGIAKAAALTALVEAAFGAVKGLVSQAADGRYPVVGASDGRTYYPGRTDKLTTGIVKGPLLVGEAGSEAIIDHRTLMNRQRDAFGMSVMDHYNSILAIRAGQGLPVPQRATGSYTQASTTGNQIADIGNMVLEMRAMRTEMSNWQRNFKVNFVMTEYDKKRKSLDDMNKDITYRY